jgi:uncharacterized protein YwgA
MLSSTLNSVRRAEILSSFVKFLSEAGFRFDLEDFDSRLKLQKYVFLARKFGLDLGYKFSMYIRGPYSPDLAQDYYNLPKRGADIPDSFDRKGFLELVKGKDRAWLEAAATILMIYEDTSDLSWAIERTSELKPWISKERIEEIARDLDNAGLI